MRLKRLYDHTSETPKVSGVLILRAGPKQHFSPNVVDGGIQEGWLSMADGHIVIHGTNRVAKYKILRSPGRYPLANDKYEVIHYYDCVLEV